MPSFFRPLSRLWRGASTKRRPLTRPGRTRLTLQLLEGREVPAGNVVGLLSATGTLTLTGVNGLGALSNQNFLISGNGTDSVIVDGNTADPTTINLGGGPVIYTGVKTIVVNLQAGDDTVTFNDVDLTGTVTVNALLGNNSVVVGDIPGTVSHFGNLIINEGAGNDAVLIHNGTHTIDGELRITGGNGTNSTVLGTDPGDTLDVGKLTITGGTGFDVLVTGGDAFAAHGAVSLNFGAGGSTTVFSSTISNTIEGETTLRTTAGFDSVSFGLAAVETVQTQKVTLALGDGGTNIGFGGAVHEVNGDLTITAGAGFDSLATFGNTFHVAGNFKYTVGAGGSAISMGSDTIDAIDGATTVLAGAGTDTAVFGVGSNGDVTMGPVTISNGNNDSVVVFGGLNNAVNGNLTVTNGATLGGTNVLVASGDSFTVAGTLTFTNSTAASTVAVFTPTSTLDLQGPVKITNYIGDDTAVFGTAGSTTVTMGSSLTISNGPGAGTTVLAGLAVAIAGDVKVTNGTSATADIFDASGADQLGVTGNFTIANGEGPSTLSLGGTVQGSIGGKLFYTAGTGGDAVAISMMDLNEVVITLGNGGDAVAFADTVSVFGNLTLAAGTGGQAVVEDATVNGNVTITTGSGGDAVAIAGGVGGKLTVSTGGGSDVITADNISVGGATFINTGDLADLVSINGSFFSGTVSVLLGAGDDELDIATNPGTGFETTFNQAVVLNTGFGDDKISIGIDFDDFNRGVFNGTVTFDGAGGINDVLEIGPPRKNSFAFLPVLVGGWDVII